jgi:hypothetical protein
MYSNKHACVVSTLWHPFYFGHKEQRIVNRRQRFANLQKKKFILGIFIQKENKSYSVAKNKISFFWRLAICKPSRHLRFLLFLVTKNGGDIKRDRSGHD